MVCMSAYTLHPILQNLPTYVDSLQNIVYQRSITQQIACILTDRLFYLFDVYMDC
jgi:hypothetical protein